MGERRHRSRTSLPERRRSARRRHPSPRLESNQRTGLRRTVHFPLCYEEKTARAPHQSRGIEPNARLVGIRSRVGARPVGVRGFEPPVHECDGFTVRWAHHRPPHPWGTRRGSNPDLRSHNPTCTALTSATSTPRIPSSRQDSNLGSPGCEPGALAAELREDAGTDDQPLRRRSRAYPGEGACAVRELNSSTTCV